MSEYKPIPVGVALQIAEQFDKSQVVILAWDPVHKLTHTVTYGVSAFDKENAAAVCSHSSSGSTSTGPALPCTTLGCDLGQKQSFGHFHRDYDPELKRDNEKLKAALAVYEFTLQFVLKLKGTPLEDLMATQIVAARMAYKEAVPDGDTYRMFLEEPA